MVARCIEYNVQTTKVKWIPPYNFVVGLSVFRSQLSISILKSSFSELIDLSTPVFCNLG